jgi:hypothetical protein
MPSLGISRAVSLLRPIANQRSRGSPICTVQRQPYWSGAVNSDDINNEKEKNGARGLRSRPRQAGRLRGGAIV